MALPNKIFFEQLKKGYGESKSESPFVSNYLDVEFFNTRRERILSNIRKVENRPLEKSIINK